MYGSHFDNGMETLSPKHSPQRGSRSPSLNSNDQSGLKMKLQIQPKPLPFYLMKSDNIIQSEVTGATNLMASKNLEHSFAKLASKKMKDSLSSFLPNLPGMIDSPGSQDNSSLRGVIDKPPVGGKEIVTLNQFQLTGFRLHPGPLPEQYRAVLNQVTWKDKKKSKKRSKKGSDTPAHETIPGGAEEERERKRKHKKHDKESEERRKKKKEKKKKKYRDEKDV